MSERGFTAADLAKQRQARQMSSKPRTKGVLPFMPSDPEMLAVWLTLAFRPPKGWEFERFDRTSKRKVDPCSITFRNSRERHTIRFDRQSELSGGGLRGIVAAHGAGWLQMPHLTPGEIEDVWMALCTIGRVMTEYDDRDETTKWAHLLLDETKPLIGKTLVPDGRHDGLMALRTEGEFVRRDAEQLVKGTEGWQRRPTRFVDEMTGFQYVRSGEAATFVRWVLGVRELAHSTLRARLAEIGVEAQHHQDHRPPHPKLTLYKLSEDLVEYIESAHPTPAKQQPLGPVSTDGERMAF